MIPARIDSHGNPGIPGICIVLLLNAVDVSVVTLVVVEVVMELLVLVVDAVMRLVEVEVVVVVAVVEVLENVDDPEVTTIVVVPALEPAIGGLNGSRWNIPASGLMVVAKPVGPPPTVHPSCVLPGCPYTELSSSPGVTIGGEIVVAVQICPS